MAKRWTALALLALLAYVRPALAAPEEEYVAAPPPAIELMSDPAAAPLPRNNKPADAENGAEGENAADVTAGIPEAPDNDEATPPAVGMTHPIDAPVPAPSPEPDYFQRHIDEFNRASTDEAAGADAETTPPTEGGLAYVLQVLFSLLLLCGVIVVGGWVFRRFGANTPLLAGPSLGSIMGRLYLTPKASLHYVRTGGRVIIVGVTQQGIQPVAEFDADTFDAAQTDDAAPAAGTVTSPTDFLAQLRGNASKVGGASARAAEDDLSSLRGEIQQLQEYLRSRPRDVEE